MRKVGPDCVSDSSIGAVCDSEGQTEPTEVQSSFLSFCLVILLWVKVMGTLFASNLWFVAFCVVEIVLYISLLTWL